MKWIDINISHIPLVENFGLEYIGTSKITGYLIFKMNNNKNLQDVFRFNLITQLSTDNNSFRTSSSNIIEIYEIREDFLLRKEKIKRLLD